MRMDIEEIRQDLTAYIRRYYQGSEVHHIDVPGQEVELRFSLDEEERNSILEFFADNLAIFTDTTDRTEGDILENEEIFMRFDTDGLYFGKSEYDLAASNAAAYYLLSRYLEEMVEEIPEKMKSYKENYLYQ